MRTGLAAAVATAVVVLAGSSSPAAALSISAPGPTSLGTASPGQTLTTQLGPVTVSSGAGAMVGWTATVSLTQSLSVTQGSQSWTFPASRVRYWSGAATAVTGLAGVLCTPGQDALGTARTLESPRTAYSCGSIAALTPWSLTWRPTVVVSTQSTDPAGTYSGTITHSVS